MLKAWEPDAGNILPAEIGMTDGFDAFKLICSYTLLTVAIVIVSHELL
jgi:hypothetical protein